MSLLTKGIGLVKKVKHKFDADIKARTPVYISPVRRIERVKTTKKICAMTFDDGPCRMTAAPTGDGKPLTLSIIETLEKFGAKGTFDIVGDTSGNYPDIAGKQGSASWGGIKYDHYPDINMDASGGAVNCPELIGRILSGGHEIASHTFAHVLWGYKPLVYGKRAYLGDIDKVIDDLCKLHDLIKNEYGYEIKLSRPPHYVNAIGGGLTSYDAYAAMGYQYMAASFDGAGWLPLATYEAEVEAMYRPIERALKEDENYFCGQIIFQKDGFNMARRTPVADGLIMQLELLCDAGYEVVTVSELLEESPFADICDTDEIFQSAKKLLDSGLCPAFRDNTVRPEKAVSRGEMAQIVFGAAVAKDRIDRLKSGGKAYFADVAADHPYGAAINLAVMAGCFENGKTMRPDDIISGDEARAFLTAKYGAAENIGAKPTRAEIFEKTAKMC